VPDGAAITMPVLDDVFTLLLSLDTLKPHPSLPKRLGPLLRDLSKPIPSQDPKLLAELIHALWITNRDQTAEYKMANVISAIDRGDQQQAHDALLDLSKITPEWPEVSYKQAIVALMQGETDAALRHLGNTLRLEPRHFAALSLFGQICLDCDRLFEARIALLKAFELNPHLKGVKEVILAIDRTLDSPNNRLNG